jgi:Raf kinase inhibitor-like YbhB/YbcL family protein
MRLTSDNFREGEAIPGEFAFIVPDRANHVSLSANRNPHLTWSDVPQGTKSFVLICRDPDVPSRPDDVNKEDREIASSLPRIDFFHWLLVDIPAAAREIGAGDHSNGVTPHGKSGPAAPGGMRHGLNDYSKWFDGDAGMEGAYYGYDGPAPPWNDPVIHRYVFTLYALDTPHLDVDGKFTGKDVQAALAGHVLAEASLTGTYSTNPSAGCAT